MSATARRVGLICLIGAVLAGCSSSDEETTVVSTPPTLAVEALHACSGKVGAIAPQGEALLLLKATTNASVRPPGGCAGIDPCGHFLVRVDGADAGPGLLRFASRVMEIPLDGLPQPFGPHSVAVELHGDAETVILDAAGKPVSVTLQIDVLPPDDPACAPPAG